MTDNYAKAYTEVLEILKYLPEEEYNKIPKEKIEFYYKHSDKDYIYHIDVTKPLDEQNISDEANAVIVTLFRDFFATEEQKEKLENILNQNEQKYEAELREKYNPDNMFENKGTIADVVSDEQNAETAMIEYKETIFTMIKNWFKRILKR